LLEIAADLDVLEDRVLIELDLAKGHCRVLQPVDALKVLDELRRVAERAGVDLLEVGDEVLFDALE